jgi:hypothetical protein
VATAAHSRHTRSSLRNSRTSRFNVFPIIEATTGADSAMRSHDGDCRKFPPYQMLVGATVEMRPLFMASRRSGATLPSRRRKRPQLTKGKVSWGSSHLLAQDHEPGLSGKHGKLLVVPARGRPRQQADFHGLTHTNENTSLRYPRLRQRRSSPSPRRANGSAAGDNDGGR